MERDLNKYYYDIHNAASYSSTSRLKKELKDKYKAEEIENWTEKQPTITQFANRRRNFKTNPAMSWKANSILHIDLADLRKHEKYNRKYNYLAVIVDVLTRFGYVFPLKTKKADEMVSALEKLFKNTVKPSFGFFSDGGGEFNNRKVKALLEKNGIKLLIARNEERKSFLAERRIQVLKNRLYKYFHKNNTEKWIDVINQINTNVNNSVNRTIGMTPADAMKSKENQKVVFLKLYKEYLMKRPAKSKFNVGETVRLPHYKGLLDKSYGQTWTTEEFYINKKIDKKFPVFEVNDKNKEVIQGRFHSLELKRTKK